MPPLELARWTASSVLMRISAPSIAPTPVTSSMTPILMGEPVGAAAAAETEAPTAATVAAAGAGEAAAATGDAAAAGDAAGTEDAAADGDAAGLTDAAGAVVAAAASGGAVAAAGAGVVAAGLEHAAMTQASPPNHTAPRTGRLI